MAKNTKTYLLLGVVLLIWGIIGYKIVKAISPDEPELFAVENVNFKPLRSTTKKDTFSILANYRDPFLGTLPKQKVKKRKIVAKKSEEPEINIKYTGSILDSNTKNSIFFVTIDGTQFLMKQGEIKSKVTLLKGTENAIKIRSNKRTRNIQLQQ